MKLGKSLKIALPLLVVIAILIALLFPWQCSQAQTARKEGQLTITIDYTANQDAALTELYGKDWAQTIRNQWREAFRNRVQEARQAYKDRRASIFDEQLSTYLTDTEKRQLSRAYDSALVRLKADEVRKAEAVKEP